MGKGTWRNLEHGHALSPRRATRRSLAGSDKVCRFSRLQQPNLEDLAGVD
jgi:hypothetical protein